MNNLQFLTENRIDQFNLLLYTIEHNIKKWENLPESTSNYSTIDINDPSGFLNISFFKNWFVGFVCAEGSFFALANDEFMFSISQSNNKYLMQAIHLMFKPSRGIYFNEKTKSSLVRMSSIADIQKVINFFSFDDNYPLLGYKKEQYLAWLREMRKSKRYENLMYP
uniref:Homing endonuclease LAGLIDADG domain-containing protein n=1 Tax=Dactylella tenuis TaxID=383872 RepID=A0A4Y5MUZ4_9PEZI|nr:hypothetical protein [Dactylella tenuis]QCW06844.1 hypothetical protein [Dactylella tenuis]